MNQLSFEPVSRITPLPLPVLQLAPREREVAEIVYGLGRASAKDVEMRLSATITNGAVRSMLGRLVRKGLLRFRPGRRGRGHECIYFPALDQARSREMAIRRFAEDHFGGSMVDATQAMLQLLQRNLAA